MRNSGRGRQSIRRFTFLSPQKKCDMLGDNTYSDDFPKESGGECERNEGKMFNDSACVKVIFMMTSLMNAP